MADGLSFEAKRTRWSEACEQVGRWLTSKGAVRLGREVHRLYPDRSIRAGWRVSVVFPEGVRRFDILVSEAFPFAPPRLALVDRPRHLTWPHLESDGYLCLLPESATTVSNDPVAVLTHLLNAAVEWLEASEAGTNVDDFRAEFNSYWYADAGAPVVRSLLDPQGPSRAIFVHQLKGIYIVADAAITLARWLDHALPLKDKTRRKIEPALLVWLDQPLLPSEYPTSAGDVARLVRDTGLGAELDRLGADQLERIMVVLGAQTSNGPALAGVILQHQGRGGPSGSFGGLDRGFRPGHTPRDLLARRFLTPARCSKTSVERVDPTWIHGRGVDPDLPRLRAAKVVMIGCGSLGGPVAQTLAQTGVGTLDLIDPEDLKAANVGRHPLGVSEIGIKKVEALSSRIRADYPHILHARDHVARWENISVKRPDILERADLIVSTIGNWAAEGLLDAWRHNRASKPNMIFGWTEPHAVAGHVVGLLGEPGCLACGLSPWGIPYLTVADWPEGTGQRGEPACGVMFQPYGPVEASHVAALISEAAIDVLLGRKRLAAALLPMRPLI